MTVPVYNAKGEEAGKTDLPPALFDVEWSGNLVHQVAVSQAANRRQGSAHTKTKGEVSGGGKKPWSQKGTGRARHGSIRSPIWKGGGVTFGPRAERVFTKSINKKMRRKALFCLLSARARDKQIIVVEALGAEHLKTKAMGLFLGKLPSNKQSTLVVLPEMNTRMIGAVRNLPYATTMQAKDLNALDVLQRKYLVLPRDSITVLEKTFVK
ncbi:50S ribosomal protein L4 [Patescibacteria group bacterium]|nr:50S ribosomal protein L4 [Patescibacteria group bacterium]